MRTNPAISVLLPVYNGAQCIESAVKSILDQTFTDFELIIINDASTDSSEYIIKSFTDSRIRYVSNQANLGLSKSLNKGIDLCEGTYIARMDQDDIALPERFKTQLEFMEYHEEIGLCGSWFQNFGAHDSVEELETEHYNIVFKLLHQFHMLHPSWFIRKSFIEQHELKYDPNTIANDYDFITRFVTIGKVANVPKVLMKYRQDPKSLSKQKEKQIKLESYDIKNILFQSIGLKLTNKELDLYEKLAHREYSKSQIFLTRVSNLTAKLKKANDQSQFFPPDFFNAKLGFMWFHSCANSGHENARFNTYKNHPLSESRQHVSVMEVIKLWLKDKLRID